MRPSIVAILAAASAAGSALDSAAFAQTAATDPVGFITVDVGGGGAQSAPKVSLVSPTLLRPVEWQGAATISGTSVTVSGTPWTAGQFGTDGQFFVEIAAGTTPGAWTDIESSTTNSLVTLDNISSFAGATPTIRIRRHTRISDFLGTNNSVGLKSGSELALADEVAVYDGSNSTTYWYYDGSAGGIAGWRDGNSQPAANAIIAPNQGVIIRRKSANPVSFVSMGSVKTGNTFFPIRAGLNVLGTVSAKGLTLATSGLHTGSASTGVKGATELALADEITIFSGGTSATYWYYDGTEGGTAGWRDSAANLAGAVSIVPGSSIILRRKAPGVAFNWSVPSPTSF